LNRRRIWNGLNAYNHSFYTRPASATRLARRRPRSAAGTLTRLRLPAAFLGERRLRDVALYAPPNAVEAVPLVIVWDGTDYERRARLPVIVDNLINAGRIRPVALAMIANGRGARLVEYLESSATVGWVERVLLPVANEHLKLIDPARHPGAWGVMGASLGGLMALYTGLRFGHIFGHVLAQSASVHLSAFGQRSHVWALAADRSLPPIRIWQNVGTLEPLLEVNRELRAVLASSQHVSAYHEANAGHNYTAWSNSLWRGLEMLFGEKRLL
jgi:enterochelin esterase family protein